MRPMFKAGNYQTNIEFNGRELNRYVGEVVTHEIEETKEHNAKTLYNGNGYYYRVSEDKRLGWVSSEYSIYSRIGVEIPEYLRDRNDEILKFLSAVQMELDKSDRSHVVL